MKHSMLYFGGLLFGISLGAAPALAQYQCFYSNLHAHTSYSDGVSTPDTAYAYARNVAHVNVEALTEHDNGQAWTISPVNYQNERLVADTMTVPGTFVALAGIEIGSEGAAGFGHINVWEAPVLTPGFFTTQGSLLDCYHWITSQGLPSQFNHPGASYDNIFNGLHYYPEFDQAVGLMEIMNGDHTFEFYFLKALAGGWQLGVTANQDNHNHDWGNKNGALGIPLTGIWADTLTKPAILAALLARRTFAMRCKPAAGRMEVSLKADDHWMGERFLRTIGTVALEINARSQDSAFKRLDLYSDGAVIDSMIVNQKIVSWKLSKPVGVGSHYFYVKINQAGGGTAWSSPAFVEVVSKSSNNDEVTTWPTPVASGGARIAYVPIDGVTSITVDIYNLSGARVWHAESAHPTSTLAWDGLDMRGKPMPNGVYIILVEQKSPTQTKLSKGKTMVSR